MPISKPHSSLGADNKGSCSNLALYLRKENEYLDSIRVSSWKFFTVGEPKTRIL
jgi:hypothetical protein